MEAPKKVVRLFDPDVPALQEGQAVPEERGVSFRGRRRRLGQGGAG